MDEPGPAAGAPAAPTPPQQRRERRRQRRVGQLRAVSLALKHSRFSVVVLVVGLALMLSDQGRDLLIAYEEDARTLRLAAAAMIWALSTWFWSRVLLDIDYGEPLPDLAAYNRWRRWTPRLLGALAFAAVVAAALRAGCTGLALWSGAGLVLFLTFVVLRRRLSNLLADWLHGSRRAVLARAEGRWRKAPIGDQSLPPHGSLWQALQPSPQGRLPLLTTIALLAVFAVLCVWSFVHPVSLGQRSGAMILFFVWAATWLPVGSAMSYAADRHGLPLLTLLLALALVSSFWNDNHEVRQLDVQQHDPAQRPTVAAALGAWAAAASAPPGQRRPFVVVATAGGGIRAAYWTGTVLGDLDDRAPAWRSSLFALSGVSGGSVGATVYRALRELPPQQMAARCPQGLRPCTQQALGEESLGPLAAALLFPDLGQRFWPAPWFPDRAAALEQAWEAAFVHATGSDGLASPLAGLGARPPALFLNATWSEEGRRIAASNLRIDRSSAGADEASAFARLHDQLAVLGRDLRLSSAAHNSARFPYVSPPGSWRGSDGRIAGRLQDGGLFENYGAETALEVLELACRRFDCGGGDGSKPQVMPVVVQITSDPSLPENLLAVSGKAPIGWGYELLSTPTSYERARTGRGAEAAARLRAWAAAPGRHYFQLRMCPGPRGGQPPLGWALSDAARARIDGFLARRGQVPPSGDCEAANAQAAAGIASLLGAPP